MNNKLYFKTSLKNQELEFTKKLVERSEKQTIDTDNDCSENANNDRVLVNSLQYLDSNKKWMLSTRKFVGNELFTSGSQYDINDHPSKSLIIDPDDENYLKY